MVLSVCLFLESSTLSFRAVSKRNKAFPLLSIHPVFRLHLNHVFPFLEQVGWNKSQQTIFKNIGMIVGTQGGHEFLTIHFDVEIFPSLFFEPGTAFEQVLGFR